MGRLRCKCDHVIVDTTDNLPYAADIIPDQSFYASYDRIEEVIDSLIESTKEGKRKEWIESQFGTQYPKDLSNTQMIDDIFTSRLADLKQAMYQCEKCNRIWIQKGQSNQYVSFMPEDEAACANILNRKNNDS